MGIKEPISLLLPELARSWLIAEWLFSFSNSSKSVTAVPHSNPVPSGNVAFNFVKDNSKSAVKG